MSLKQKWNEINTIYRQARQELPPYRERNTQVITALNTPNKEKSKKLWNNYAIVTCYRAARRFVHRFPQKQHLFEDLFSATLARSIELFPTLAKRHARDPITHVSGIYHPYIWNALRSEARKMHSFASMREPSSKMPGPIEEHVREALRGLSSRDRAMVEAYYTHGLAPAQIGKAAGMTQGSVHTTLWRLRKKLRRQLSAVEPRKTLKRTIQSRHR